MDKLGRPSYITKYMSGFFSKTILLYSFISKLSAEFSDDEFKLAELNPIIIKKTKYVSVENSNNLLKKSTLDTTSMSSNKTTNKKKL